MLYNIFFHAFSSFQGKYKAWNVLFTPFPQYSSNAESETHKNSNRCKYRTVEMSSIQPSLVTSQDIYLNRYIFISVHTLIYALLWCTHLKYLSKNTLQQSS